MHRSIEVKNLSCCVALAWIAISVQQATAIELPPLVWKPIFLGVESTSAILIAPRPIRLHVLRIDLAAEGVSVIRPIVTDHATTKLGRTCAA